MLCGTITHSQKGKEKLVLDGFVYNCTKRWGNGALERISWDCEQRKSEGSHAAVTTDSGYAVVSRRGQHSHATSAHRARVLDVLRGVL